MRACVHTSVDFLKIKRSEIVKLDFCAEKNLTAGKQTQRKIFLIFISKIVLSKLRKMYI